MSDTLIIGGTTYNNVAGFKATDSGDNELTFVRPTGTKQISITQNGTVTEDVAAYASAEISVNVQGGGGVRKLTLVCGNASSLAPVIRGIWNTELDEIEIDCDHLNVFPAPGYCAVKGKPKLTYKNAESATTITDFCRQGVTFAEVDFGGCAPTTIRRLFYQGGYTPQIDGESAMPSVVNAYNLNLSNVTTWETIVNQAGTTINLIFSGTLSVASATYSDANVTVDSIVSLLNCLVDVTESGDTHTITLGNNRARLSAEQIAIATEKGWTVA